VRPGGRFGPTTGRSKARQPVVGAKPQGLGRGVSDFGVIRERLSHTGLWWCMCRAVWVSPAGCTIDSNR